MRLNLMLLFVLLISPVAYAQLDWVITDLRCGNGKLDEFELCDKGLNETEGYCDDLADILGIDTVCDTQHCTCLPRVNKAYCGNNKREGVELCDGSGPDKCPEYGNVTGLNLSCNKKTCGCSLSDSVPSDYDPAVIDELNNISQKASVCGDKKIERNEECDPPDTLCTTGTKDPGICTLKCECVRPDLLVEEEEEKSEAPQAKNGSAANFSEEPIQSENSSAEPKSNESVKSTPESSEPGFFSKFWAWIVSIFS